MSCMPFVASKRASDAKALLGISLSEGRLDKRMVGKMFSKLRRSCQRGNAFGLGGSRTDVNTAPAGTNVFDLKARVFLELSVDEEDSIQLIDLSMDVPTSSILFGVILNRTGTIDSST